MRYQDRHRTGPLLPLLTVVTMQYKALNLVIGVNATVLSQNLVAGLPQSLALGNLEHNKEDNTVTTQTDRPRSATDTAALEVKKCELQ